MDSGVDYVEGVVGDVDVMCEFVVVGIYDFIEFGLMDGYMIDGW